ncbi:unnamed protein product, partial [Rotaria sp. Silwood1]
MDVNNCDGINLEIDTCSTRYGYNIWLIGKTGTGAISFCSKIDADTKVGLFGAICGLAVRAGEQKYGERDL